MDISELHAFRAPEECAALLLADRCLSLSAAMGRMQPVGAFSGRQKHIFALMPHLHRLSMRVYASPPPSGVQQAQKNTGVRFAVGGHLKNVSLFEPQR